MQPYMVNKLINPIGLLRIKLIFTAARNGLMADLPDFELSVLREMLLFKIVLQCLICRRRINYFFLPL